MLVAMGMVAMRASRATSLLVSRKNLNSWRGCVDCVFTCGKAKVLIQQSHTFLPKNLAYWLVLGDLRGILHRIYAAIVREVTSVTHSGLITRLPISLGCNYLLGEKWKAVAPGLPTRCTNAPLVTLNVRPIKEI